jgi:hypothetical protein
MRECGTRLAGPAALLVVAVLAGCGGDGGSRPASVLPPGSVLLPRLPAQGLIDDSRRGVALRDLRGRRLAWLRGFAPYPSGAAAQASPASWFQGARLREPLLYGPKGWYQLDAGRHALLPVKGARLPLAGGAAVLARPNLRFAVERNGRVVLRALSPTFWILSSQLVQSGTTLLDVGTGRRWRLPRNCLTAGFHGETLILACSVAHGAEAVTRLRLERMVPGRPARPMTTKLAELIPEAASLSPDGAWVAVEGFTGCAASYVYVAPVAGGAARVVYGRSATDPFAANYSSLLGWSADGRLVVYLEPQHCDTPYGPQHPPHGVYLIDPRTLARTFVTRSASAMWNSAARR